VGTPFSLFVHVRAAARAQELPAGRARRIAKIDAGAAARADPVGAPVGLRLWLGWASDHRLLDRRAALEHKAAVGTTLVVRGNLPGTPGTGQRPRLTARGAGGVIRADERTAGRT
jgi:hypothetical protein